LVRTYDGENYPSLALAALQDRWIPAALTDHWLLLKSPSERVDLQIPLEPDGQYLLNPYSEFETYSMSGLLLTMQRLRQGQIENLPLNPADLNDKIVFVGASAVGVEDLKMTSFGSLQPGVFLHAAIAGNVLEKDFLRQADFITELIILVLFSVLLPLTILLGRHNGWRVMAPMFLFVLFLLGTYQAFRQGIVLDSVLPATGMSLAWLGALARLSATEGRDKRRIRAMFGQYVSPQILESLTAHAARGLLQAEIGRREHLCILFSDIRGFTSMSEHMAPEAVVEILNGYFRGMVDIIFLRKGTLDKFIGDAIMAFWGAPLRIEQPARQAVTAAVEMVKWLETYNKGLVDRGISPLEIGIGLHSGSVVLGNIGSEKKLDFTIIGDNVNLASRLEGLTKNYGCRVLISESTRVEIGDDFVCRVLDSVRVKGKKQPIRIFEVLAVPTDDSDARRRAQKRAEMTACAFEFYLRQDWASAIAGYAALSDSAGSDPLTQLFTARCQFYQQQSPGKDWDGVYQMTTK
jgi:adenylate cyclase